MSSILFRATDIREIDLIRLLWENLNEHHRALAGEFTNYYSKISFEDRKEFFKRKAASGTFRLDLALDEGTGDRCIGYCITSLSEKLEGEIESIFVEQSYRLAGIGTMLVTRALAWLDRNGSTGTGFQWELGTKVRGNSTGNLVFIPGWQYLNRKGNDEGFFNPGAYPPFFPSD